MTNTASKVADRAKGSTPSIGAPTSDNDTQTPLHLAVRNGKEGQDTLLHQAVREGQEAAVAILLEAKDSNGKTPLENSIKNGQKGITRILADKNADVELVQLDEAQGSEGRTSLHKAISSGHPKANTTMKATPHQAAREGNFRALPVFNYPLPEKYYYEYYHKHHSIPTRSPPTASRRLHVSTGSNRSYCSAESYQLRDSANYPPTPSEKGDR
jgi:Ankyrin repeats (3 copies)